MSIAKVCAVALLSPSLYGADTGLTQGDMQKIKRLHEKYRRAWLAGDANGVRSVFVDQPGCYHITEIHRA